MRPAGKASALGNVSPKDYGRILRTCTWSLSYNDKAAPAVQTEARAKFFSTLRDNAMRAAASEVLATPSSSNLKEQIRKTNIRVGFERPGEAEERRQTRSKCDYVKPPMPDLQKADENRRRQIALRESHIDLAFGSPKTCTSWQTDQSAHLGAKADLKFACEGRATGVNGHSNYKTNIRLSHGNQDRWQSEAKCIGQYAHSHSVGNHDLAHSLAAKNGKELSAHSWDHGMGQAKTTTKWRPAQSAEYARMAEAKFNCVKPTVDTSVGRFLRASNIYLGRDEVDYSEHEGRFLIHSSSAPAPLGHA
mmetsp:Transcript_32633/g.60833  ORF Transcript_32633/g.60833 Transcript_32633/m.60833 type:complete len:305 (+) Transcript_32633:45-959(+)